MRPRIRRRNGTSAASRAWTTEGMLPGRVRAANCGAGAGRRLARAGAAVALAVAVLAAAGAAARPARAVARSAAFEQGTAVATAARVARTTMVLSRPVTAGDLLVGWFAQYNVHGRVRVADNVNGAWTRAAGALTFQSENGDIALYYLADSKRAAGGLTITVSASAPAFLQGTAADYAGLAVAGPLDRMTAARGVAASVVTGRTAPVAAGELVYSAILTGVAPAGPATPGRSHGASYVGRAQSTKFGVYEQDILAATAGRQQGAATLATATDWYAVAATFRVNPHDSKPPATPAHPAVRSTSSSRVALGWSPRGGQVTGYAIWRNGKIIGTAAAGARTYLDATAAPGHTYRYAVAAFDGSGLRSGRSAVVVARTPLSSPSFVQGAAASPGTPVRSLTLRLTGRVAAGDLLVGWFGQYHAPGGVKVSDSLNGTWARRVSEHFSDGTGELALEIRPDAKTARHGLTITITASAPAFLAGAVADFRGIRRHRPLLAQVAGSGSAAIFSVGPTAGVPGGDLVIGATITSGQPGYVLAGASKGVPYLVNVHVGSSSATLEDILSSAAGPQRAAGTLGAASTSYTVAAVFAAKHD